ncbi:hypothetical protein ACIQI7_08875 [Kitasatospora sp. NPDC092039]|uniref:hypothetical protein n=1 Tax=Kitasatospora sp. NPDC092039 TaxID=3364086 RepID=UPI00382617E5
MADALFSRLPTEFTKARDEAAARARAAGERALAARIKVLHRPTAAAFAVNRLARACPEQTGQLLDLGVALLRAQEELAGPVLRELSAQRHRLVAALTAQARGLAAEAGVRLGEAQLREVEQTLRAALASPRAAAEVAAGRLSAAIEEPAVLPVVAGEGQVEKAGRKADVRPKTAGGRPGRRETREVARKRDAARQEAQQQEARRHMAGARAELEVAERRHRDAAHRRDRLAAQVEDLGARRDQAAADVDRAQAALHRAQEQLEGAVTLLAERQSDLGLATTEADTALADATRARDRYRAAQRATRRQEGAAKKQGDEDLSALTKAQLYERATRLEIPNRSTMDRGQLHEAVEKTQGSAT